MSNPGVIELSNIKTSVGVFRIEDNLGESIHIHIGEFRIDLTINNLHKLAEQCKEIIDAFISVEKFSCKVLDPIFLMEIAEFLPDIEEIDYKKVLLSELKIDTYNNIHLPVYRGLEYSRVYRALQGDTQEDDKRRQENDFGVSNHERTLLIDESIREKGYMWKCSYIVLFNDQMIIRDGQHRAASLYNLDKNQKIEVLVIRFVRNKHSMSRHPILNFLFCWDGKRIYKLAKRTIQLLKGACYQLQRRIYCKIFTRNLS